MNRRSFLTRVCTGIVGAAVVTHVPVKWLPAPVKRYAALEYLRQHFNAYDKLPGGMIIHPYLYEEAELEMVHRAGVCYYTLAYPVPNFIFVGVPVTYDRHLVKEDPRKVQILSDDEWKRYVAARVGPFGDGRL